MMAGVKGFRSMLRAARRDSRRAERRATSTAVMPLTASLSALGSTSWTEDVHAVPVDRVVGTVARTDEFDRQMRPLRGHLADRWNDVAAAVAANVALPPVRLVRLGELYFVVDGHHRVSVARASGVATVEALVRHVCTVAYACHCLTVLDLPVKAAERRFLERFPLPDDVRPWLWLDDPADWARLEDLAEAWLLTTAERAPAATTLDDLVAIWWHEEVVPTAHRCRSSIQTSLDDYLCALRSRDARGCCTS